MRKFRWLSLLMLCIMLIIIFGCSSHSQFYNDLYAIAVNTKLLTYYNPYNGKLVTELKAVNITIQYNTDNGSIYANASGYFQGLYGHDVDLFYKNTPIITPNMLRDKENFHWEKVK